MVRTWWSELIGRDDSVDIIYTVVMPKRKTSFNNDLQEKYSAFRKGRDEYEAECMVCCYGTYVSVKNKGVGDLEAHITTNKHKNALRGGESSSKISNFFIQDESKIGDQVAATECTIAYHTLKHPFSYRSNDCKSTLFSKSFPDSNIVKKYSCARTKTEAIINNVLAPYCVENVLSELKDHNIEYIGVATDGGNHKPIKLFPVLIQYFEWKEGGLQSKLIEAQNTPNETSDTIANLVKEALEKIGIYAKCVAFTGDNCNTNFGGAFITRGEGLFAKND